MYEQGVERLDGASLASTWNGRGSGKKERGKSRREKEDRERKGKDDMKKESLKKKGFSFIISILLRLLMDEGHIKEEKQTILSRLNNCYVSSDYKKTLYKCS